MNRQQLQAEIEAADELQAGEAMYFDGETVTIGRENCQPSNTCCLRVGPDAVWNLNVAEILDGAEHLLAD